MNVINPPLLDEEYLEVAGMAAMAGYESGAVFATDEDALVAVRWWMENREQHIPAFYGSINYPESSRSLTPSPAISTPARRAPSFPPHTLALPASRPRVRSLLLRALHDHFAFW